LYKFFYFDTQYINKQEIIFIFVWETKRPFNLNQNWFNWRNYKNLAGLSKFIDTVLQRKDVFIVSIADMLHWIKNPTPMYKINKSIPWEC